MPDTGPHIVKLQNSIRAAFDELCRIQLASQAIPILDYEIIGSEGNRNLSEYFSSKILVIHNMGIHCNFCTTYADGISAVTGLLQEHFPVLLVSASPPEKLFEFSSSRGWKFEVASLVGTTFSQDLRFVDAQGLLPGMAVFTKSDGGIDLVSKTFFHPSDHFSILWPILQFAGTDTADWVPSL